MGQQVKCPQKMKAPDSFRNPGLWCDFHRDHGHKTEDCIALKIEVNELLKKGHLWDGISHAAAKKSTWNAKQALEAAKPKRLHLDTDKISFTTKEQERVLSPHHDALVISFTVANCLVKRILVDNGSSGNIIFQAAYKDLGLEKSALTRRITPLIGFSGEVRQTAGEVHSIGSFPFSRRKGLVPGTGPGVLSSGDPGRLLVGPRGRCPAWILDECYTRVFFPNSLPLITRFCHRTRGITCALKSTGVAHPQQDFPRQDIASMEKLGAFGCVLEMAEPGALVISEEEA
ncbi:hypothetical protein F2Q70_00002695 [Brassica cretica]|uniref:Uncharacterized protein n=1 Tax=Brassica cretica TaxID=69181 RepID=A0A8S9IRJ7_BRACR|nr:hypothetical protein F2Q70_00002695 [Brassica cretica]